MKTIRYIATFGAVIVGLFSSVSSTLARDYINWEDTHVKYSYDYTEQKMYVRLSVDENTRPEDVYSARIDIAGKRYTKSFSYDTNADELFLDFNTFIDRDDLDNDYDIKFRVINESRNVTEYENTLSAHVGNYLSWDDVTVQSNYNYSSRYLTVTVTLNDVTDNPNSAYYSQIKVDGKLNSASFGYDANTDKLYAVHTIYIDRSDLENNYDYQLTIKDKDYLSVYQDGGEFDVNGYNNNYCYNNNNYNYNYNSNYDYNYDYNYCNNNSNNTYYNDNDGRTYYYYNGKKYYYTNNIDWTDLVVNNYYTPSSKELNVVFSLPNVNKTPSKTYYAVLFFNGKEYTKKFTYLEDMNKLYASMTFNIGSVKEYYTINYSVINGTSTVYSRDNAKMYVNKAISSSTSSSSSYTPKVIQKYNSDDIAQKIINIAEEKYTYADEKVQYLERISNKLTNFFGSNSQYKGLINGVNTKLKEKIRYYEQLNQDENDVFGIDDAIYWK